MPKPEFQKVDVEGWRHAGRRLGLAEEDLCLCHAEPGGGRAVLAAVEELIAGGEPPRRTVTFAPFERAGAVRSVRFERVEPTDELRVMHVSIQGDAADVRLTAAGLAALRAKLTDWHAGREDFGCAPRSAGLPDRELGASDRASAEIWFWGPTVSGS